MKYYNIVFEQSTDLLIPLLISAYFLMDKIFASSEGEEKDKLVDTDSNEAENTSDGQLSMDTTDAESSQELPGSDAAKEMMVNKKNIVMQHNIFYVLYH